jgi:hypothetical protein
MKKFSLFLFLAISAILISTGCNKNKKTKAYKEREIRVELSKLQNRVFRRQIPVQGTVESVQYAVLSAKNVAFVYDKDPAKYPDAKPFKTLKYSEMLSLGLKAIDQSAAAIGEECGIKTVLFPLSEPENIIRAASGEKIGTLLHN